ncbi:MAG: hypothetical protein ACYDDO_04915 [Acidiferrobacterales bacterium]
MALPMRLVCLVCVRRSPVCYGAHHNTEIRQDLLRQIKRTVLEDIDLDTFEQDDSGKLTIEPVDLPRLIV